MKRLLFSAALVALSVTAHAQVKLDGTFVASKSCPALSSIKKRSNPGEVSVEPGQRYELAGKNKEQATHFWITIPGAEPEKRWVATACGSINGATAPTPEPPVKPTKKTGSSGGFYILALSWQPAFCEQRPDKTECKGQKSSSYEVSNFALHGLWPQPRSNVFCNVSKADIAADEAREWFQLPEVKLTPETKSKLDRVMPGTQSLLDRHEWIKHGTCYGTDAEQYYADSIRLAEAVNSSVVGRFMAQNVGKQIQVTDLREKFDEAFGDGAGQRVRVACDRDGDRLLIGEITIGLKGDLSGSSDIRDLIVASTPTKAGCTAGIVDKVGMQ
jgi:ribonuclease T2